MFLVSHHITDTLSLLSDCEAHTDRWAGSSQVRDLLQLQCSRRSKRHLTNDDDESFSIRHWTDTPIGGTMCNVPFFIGGWGRLRAGPFLAVEV